MITSIKKKFAWLMSVIMIICSVQIAFAAEETVLTKYDNCMYVNIDDKDLSENNVVKISVSYYDYFDGYFTVMYDVGNQYAKYHEKNIISGNTKQYKTAVFYIYDGVFNNHLKDGNDYLVRYFGTDERPLKISAAETVIMGEINPVAVKITSNSVGNIFFDGDTREFKIDLSNKLSKCLNVSLNYKVFNEETGEICGDITKSYTLSDKTEDIIPFSEMKYGTYIFKASIVDEKGEYAGEWNCKFSVCKKNENVKSTMGISAHPMMDNRRYKDSLKIAAKAGFDTIRTGYSQNEAQTDATVNKAGEIEKLAKDLGMNILFNVSGNNTTLFANVADNKIPENEKQRNAFAEYVYNVIAASNGNLEYVELWNEPNISSEDKGSESNSLNYAKLLRTVYNKINEGKKAQDSVTAQKFDRIKLCGICCSDILPWYVSTWIIPVLQADTDGDGQPDGYKWMDNISIHHYLTRENSYKDGSKRIDELISTNMNNIDAVLKSLGADINIIHTEFGISQIITDYSRKEHADSLSRYILSLKAYRPNDKLFIYDLSNDGDSKYDGESNLGLTERAWAGDAFSAKPALLAVSWINKIINNMKGADIVTQENGISVYRFNTGTRTVYALYSNSDCSYDFISGEENIYFYDLYGNKIENSVMPNIGVYRITLTSSPIYAVEGEAGENILQAANVLADCGFFSHQYCDEGIVINAALTNANEGTVCSVKVYDEQKQIVYIGQESLSDKGSLQFLFKGDKWNSYFIEIGNSSNMQSYRYKIFGEGKAYLDIRTVNDNSITDINDWNDNREIFLYMKPCKDAEDLKLICVGYKENQLILSKIFSLPDTQLTDGIYVKKIFASDFENADTVKFYLWDSFSSLEPLRGAMMIK